MLNDKDLVKVTNRGSWTVGYKIPELNITRCFTQNETKELSVLELRRLSWLPGGRSIIMNHLIIDNAALVKELLNDVEPEYYYTSDDIKDLLLYGTEDQLRDALDFAPQGVTELIKDIAVNIKLNDMRKREIIQKATNFDVSNAIRVNEESEAAVEEVKTRRAAPINAATQTEESSSEDYATVRRAAAPKYKVTINK